MQKRKTKTFSQLIARCAIFIVAAMTSLQVMAEDVAYAAYCKNHTLYFGFGEAPAVNDAYDGSTVSAVYTGDAVTNSGSTNPAWQTSINLATQKVVFESSFSSVKPTSLFGWFNTFRNLTEISGLENLDTSEATDMTSMFCYCNQLTAIDVGHFDTRNVTSMKCMFLACYLVEDLDVSQFNTSKVTNMRQMFDDCRSLKSLDLRNFDTSIVTDMATMFARCYALTSLDLSGFNTAKVTDMSGMFYMSNDVSHLASITFGNNFTVKKVNHFDYMFGACGALTCLDLSKFNTQNVEYYANMFYFCTNLQTIVIGDDWETPSSGTDLANDNMFEGCNALIGEDGTACGGSGKAIKAHANAGGFMTKYQESVEPYGNSSTGLWSTFYNGYVPRKADNNTTVYTAELSSDKKSVTLHEIADRIIPAGTGVVLRKNAGDIIYMTYTAEAGAALPANSLTGTHTKIDAPDNCYALSYGSNLTNYPLGFYRYTTSDGSGENQGKIAAKKAYLIVPSGARSFVSIDGNDNTTGIQAIEQKSENAEFFDLMGRKVGQNVRPGIYVSNGKKILVK